MPTSGFKVQTVENTECEAGMSNSIIRKAYVPLEASDREKSVHLYLDSMFAFSVDIKSKIEEDLKTVQASPLLKKHLLERKATMQSPSLFEKRRAKMQAAKQAKEMATEAQFQLKPEKLGEEF